MSRRKTHEQLAMTRTKRRSAQIRKLIEAIAYDWFDSEVHAISNEADHLSDALDRFDEAAKEQWLDHVEEMALKQ